MRKRTICESTARELSVKAGCDPRTIVAVLEGKSTRGLAFDRAKAALIAAGFKVPAEVESVK